MNKQELIDKAINEANGLWRTRYPLLFVSGELNVAYPKHTKFTYSPEGTPSNDFWVLVCTADEFTQRAKELGWIAGYKYGVEYPTNGKKPDLDDNILIRWFSNIGGSSECMVGCLSWFFESKCNIKSFQIIDRRYKPVSENQEKQQSVSGLSENKLKPENVSDNSRHERGELPPVGAFVDVVGEVRYGAGESNCEVIAHVENCAVIRMSWGLGCFESHVLSPSKSEREKFIERVCTALHYTYSGGHADIASALYKAGFKAPEDK